MGLRLEVLINLMLQTHEILCSINNVVFFYLYTFNLDVRDLVDVSF